MLKQIIEVVLNLVRNVVGTNNKLEIPKEPAYLKDTKTRFRHTPSYALINAKTENPNEIPSEVEYDTPREFEKIVYEAQNINCAVWHPVDDRLIAISITTETENLVIRCLVFDLSDGVLENTSDKGLPITQVYGRLLDIAHHPFDPIIVLTFHEHVYVWNYADLQILGDVSGTIAHIYTSAGFYPSGTRIWVRAQPHGSPTHIAQAYLWLVFDYASRLLTMSPVETEGYKSLGAVLHPSGKLIGVNWSSFGSGFYFHTAIPKASYLSYYRINSVRFSDWEAYSPCFSPDGKLFAFVLHPNELLRRNYSNIVIYDIASESVVYKFHNGVVNDIPWQLQFGNGGKTLAFYVHKSVFLTIWNVINGKKISSLAVDGFVKFLSVHRLRGYYAVITDTGVTVFLDQSAQTDNTVDYDGKSHFYADEFIVRHADKLLEVGDFLFD